ncbi:hypothetical protein ACFX2J_004331 [Malus domestica]
MFCRRKLCPINICRLTKNPTSALHFVVSFQSTQIYVQMNFRVMEEDSGPLIRKYCSRKKSDEWTEEIEYLDESGSVIYTGKGIRSVEPGFDDHVMVGGLKKPMLNASAIA